MEPYRGRSRTRGSYSGPRPMSVSRSRSRGYGVFGGATAGGRAAFRARAARRGVVARRARAMLNRRTAGFLGIEKKFYDTALTATAIPAPTDSTGGEFDPSATSMISTPAQGDTEQNRDGKRIVIKSVQVSGSVTAPAQTALAGVATSPQTEIFVALVLDQQTNGAQLNSEDVYKNLSAAAGNATNPLRNLLFASRFRVLKEWCLKLVPQLAVNNAAAGSVSIGASRAEFDCFIPLDLNVNFNAGTTASIANVIDNSLHIIAFASSVDMAPVIAYNARIRFMG